MRTRLAVIVALVAIGIVLAITLALLPSLPARVPTHWGLRGQIDGWGPRGTASFYLPGTMLLLLGLLAGLPLISPAGFRVEGFRATWNSILVIVIGMMGYLQLVTLQAARHPGMDSGRWLIGGVCLAFAALGNVLGRVRRNFWMGVRTPWTLASESVWIATHRFAARLFVAMGLIGAAAIALGAPPEGCFVLLLVAILAPAVHSAILSKRLERGRKE